MNEKKYFLKIRLQGTVRGDSNIDEEASHFSPSWFPLLSLPDNDMIDEDLNYTLKVGKLTFQRHVKIMKVLDVYLLLSHVYIMCTYL